MQLLPKFILNDELVATGFVGVFVCVHSVMKISKSEENVWSRSNLPEQLVPFFNVEDDWGASRNDIIRVLIQAIGLFVGSVIFVWHEPIDFVSYLKFEFIKLVSDLCQ